MSADKGRTGVRLRAERKARVGTVRAMAEALRDAASERERRRLPKLADLMRMIRSWEAGTHGLSERYRLLYCRTLDMTEEELFEPERLDDASPWRAQGVEVDDEERLVLAARAPSRLDRSVVESLTAILAEQRRLEDKIGSTLILHTVLPQRQMIDRLAAEARGPIRPQVVDVAAQWAQFSGWLFIAADDTAEARASLDLAAEYAEEIGDMDMVGTVLSWKAYLAQRTRKVGAMIGLANAARRNRHGPGAAYDTFLEARGHALAGDSQTACQLLGQAQEIAAAATPEQARPWEYYYLEPGFFELEAGLTHVYLGRDDPTENAHAVDGIAAGLAALPEWMRGAEWAGEYVAYQAIAHLQAGDAEAACATVAEAARIAHATLSQTLLRLLQAIHQRMRARWPDQPAVVELLDLLH